MICAWEGQAWHNGEKPSHWAKGPEFDAASLQNAGVRLALVIPSPDPSTLLMWEPPALGLSYDMSMPLVDLSWTRTEFQNITPKIIMFALILFFPQLVIWSNESLLDFRFDAAN